MTGKRNLINACLLSGLLGVVLASPAPAATPQTNILAYQPAFFADARPNTAYDMIKRLPGFNFDDGGNARGFAGNAGNVVIDGQRPTSKTDDLRSILARIPASNVARIEVIQGGAPGIDMHGHTVIANVIRKDNASTTIVAQASDNFFPSGETVPELKLDFTRQSGGWHYTGSIARTAGFDDSVGNGTRTLTDASGTTTRYHAQHTGRGAGTQITGAVSFPMAGGRFKTNLTLQDSPFYSSNVYKRPGVVDAISDDSGDREAEFGLHWDGPLGGTRLETLILQRLGRQTDLNISDAPGDLERFTATSDTGETIARATLSYEYSPSLSLEGGGEGAYNFLDGHTGYTANGVSVPLPSANARVEERRGEAFADATWKISKAWSLEAGARFEFSTIGETGDSSQTRSFFYPKPRAVLSWTPDTDTQIRLRVERVVGQLDFGNFIASSNLASTGVSAGNPDLKPDQRMQYAISYERHFWKKAAVVVTLMHEQITDAVDYVPVFAPGGAFDAPGNIGNGRNDKLNVEATLPLDRIGITDGLLKASISWQNSAVRDPLTGQSRGISGQRPQDISINFSQDIQRLKSTWGIDYFNGWDERYYRLASFQHSFIAPPYLQAYWEYKPTSAWSIRVEADNIVPFVYERQQNIYAGPRDSAALIEAEHLTRQSQPRLYVSIRKTFG